MSNHCRLLVSLPFAALLPLLASLPAWADAPKMGDANRLLPLEARRMDVANTLDSLNTISNQINRQAMGEDEASPNIADALSLPWLEGMLDDEGNVNLPLGITVFDTMGDFSVGIGSDF